MNSHDPARVRAPGDTSEADHLAGAGSPTLAPASLAEIVAEIIRRLGEDPSREGLLGTPQRVASSLHFLTRGMQQTPSRVVGAGMFAAESEGMVIVRDIELYSLCEHHLLPFFGKAHVAYIPKRKMVGLSKLARIVDVYARRLQVQERLTEEIADAIWSTVEPRGVGVVVEARHLCMMMRGVEKQDSKTITSAMRGVFLDDSRTRNELLELLVGGPRMS